MFCELLIHSKQSNASPEILSPALHCQSRILYADSNGGRRSWYRSGNKATLDDSTKLPYASEAFRLAMVDTYIKDAPSNGIKDQPINFRGVGQIAFFEAWLW
jgi:hypothetical protein